MIVQKLSSLGGGLRSLSALVCKAIKLTVTTLNSMGIVDRSNDSALKLVGLTLEMKTHVLPGLTVNQYMVVLSLKSMEVKGRV